GVSRRPRASEGSRSDVDGAHDWPMGEGHAGPRYSGSERQELVAAGDLAASHGEAAHHRALYTPGSRALEHRRDHHRPCYVHQTRRTSRAMAVYARRRDHRGDLRGEQQVPRIFRLQIRGKYEMRMRHIAVAVALLVAQAGAFAQNGGGISGVITSADSPVAVVPVQAKHQVTGRIFTGTSAKSGQYAITGLPDGAYDVSVPM